MLVHLLSTGLTMASVALYFAGSRGDLGTTLGAAVFTKWLDAFFYLQVRQSFRSEEKNAKASAGAAAGVTSASVVLKRIADTVVRPSSWSATSYM